jgi:prohibitin 1
VLSRPNTPSLPDLYRKLGEDYQERILPSVGNEVLKAVVARYNADQLLTMRDKVSKEIRETMTKRCTAFNLIVDDVSITHLNFSSDFARAIEAKQVAEQNAERAKFVVAKAEQEKLALIVRSHGDAEAASMVSEALSKHGQGLIELRRIECAQQVPTRLLFNLTFELCFSCLFDSLNHAYPKPSHLVMRTLQTIHALTLLLSLRWPPTSPRTATSPTCPGVTTCCSTFPLEAAPPRGNKRAPRLAPP